VEAEPPKEFLRTTSPAWQKILATPVSIEAEEIDARAAIQFVSQQAEANVNTDFGDSRERQRMKQSLSFRNVPFREVLYAIKEQWDLQISWQMDSARIPTRIHVSNRK